MKRIILTLLSCFFFLLVIDKFIDHYYKKFWGSVFEKMDVVFKDSLYYDGILIGDSRVQTGINPYYIDSLTGLSTFNLGMAGSPFNESCFLTNAYLLNHRPPKFAVVSVGYAGILEPFRFLQSPCYYFFYLDNKFNNTALSEHHYHTCMFKILPILKYTAFDDFNKITILQSLEGSARLQPQGVSYKGYINNNTTFKVQTKRGHEMEEDTVIEKGMNGFSQLIQLLKTNNCQPIIVYAPEYEYNPNNKKRTYRQIDTAIEKLGIHLSVPILHFDTDKSFTKDLFSDMDSHLTINGSAVYSRKLGIAIKQLMAVRQ